MGVLNGCNPRKEVLKGDLDDAIFAADFVDLPQGKAQGNIPESKSGEPLTSYLNEESKRILVEQKALYPDRDKVWRWKLFPRKYWSHTLEKAGVKDCWFHDIRHHVVTEVANSHGIHIAKEVAHHKSISTTEIYVNPSKNQVKEAIRGLSSTNRKVVPWSTKSLPFPKPETTPVNKKAPAFAGAFRSREDRI